MSAADAGEPLPAERLPASAVVSDALVIARRNVLTLVRTPQLLVFSTIQPVMFVLLFRFVFGGAIDVPTGSYASFLLPGVFVQTVVFGSTTAAIALAYDLKGGMIDRFRSLPMARSAVLAGRTAADAVRNLFVIVLMVIVGYAVDFRFEGGVLAAIAAMAIALLFGYAFSWFFALIGMLVRDPETAQVAGFVPLFPFVFASSIFVSPQTMPSWLRWFAEHQPISKVADAVRGLSLGTASTSDVVVALAWIGVMLLVFAPLATWRYRRG
jgi:ABC-2 type transport system permease protein/oleandomycin transport system permease protein